VNELLPNEDEPVTDSVVAASTTRVLPLFIVSDKKT
jgi:hypothetical protein